LRNLFRKAYLCQRGDLATRSRVPLELFRVAVEVSSGLGKGEMEAEEVECLLANMIYSVRILEVLFFLFRARCRDALIVCLWSRVA